MNMLMVNFQTVAEAESFFEDYMDDYLFDLIEDDGGSKSLDIEPGEIYLAAKEGDVFVGAVRFSKRTNFIAQIHLIIRKEHKSYAKDITANAIEWLQQNTAALGFVAEFPDGYPGMRKLALDFGMEKVGYLPGGWVKNGTETDLVTFYRRF